MSNDDGAVAVMVAVMSVVLFGAAAIVIDAGALYSERRQLQNGADAAAFAVARACAGGKCEGYQVDAEKYAKGNARDGAAHISKDGVTDGVCGTVTAGLPQCKQFTAPAYPGSGFVRVTARTEQKAGGHLLPSLFARVLDDNGGGVDDSGTTVDASATVIWGAPGGMTSAVPVAMSACEWKKFTKDGTALAPPPDYVAHPSPKYGYATTWLEEPDKTKEGGSKYERVFYTHGSKTETSSGTEVPCPATPPGGDASGSFGWLSDTDSTCSASTTLSPDGDPGYANQPGNTVPSVCKKGDFPPVGTIIYVPVYDYFTVKDTVSGPGGGQNIWYHVDNYAAFYVTGYNLQLPGGGDHNSLVTGKAPCGKDDRCISGFFTSGAAPSTGPVVGGSSYGANITQMVG